MIYSIIDTDRAISYRIDQHYDELSISMSVAIMKMVRSDLGSSGVCFTIDTESGHQDMLLITASYGLVGNHCSSQYIYINIYIFI